jgi:hypothetical protein
MGPRPKLRERKRREREGRESERHGCERHERELGVSDTHLTTPIQSIKQALDARHDRGRRTFRPLRYDGQFDALLLRTIATRDADRVMFAVDYPFEDHARACAWFGTAVITEQNRSKIGCDNAMTVSVAEMILTVCSYREKVDAVELPSCWRVMSTHKVRAKRRERQMVKTVFAMAVAALVFAAVSGTSQAAPIAPLPGATSADSGSVTKVWWHRHRHCWRGPYGHLHCGW